MPGGPAVSSPIRFGPFELDPESGDLRKKGVRLKLQEQPLQILQILLERPGQVVSREELRQRLWPADTFVDFDHGLYNAIKRLREALGDLADTSHFIETVPRRGYRFIGMVTRDSQPGALVGGADTSTASPVSGSAPRNRLILVTGVGLLLIFAVLAALNFGGLRNQLWARAHTPAIHSLAVLPLKNLSSDPEQEYFADGMTEELITALSRLGGLRVISRTSVMCYKKTDRSLPEIARKLNVDAIVEGSVLRSGGRVRITAQLIYAPAELNLWAESYDRDISDVLALQENVASDIAEQVHVKVTDQVPDQVTARGSRPRQVNVAAYDAYLTGEYHSHKYGAGGSPDELHKATESLRKATQIDPGFARAWLALASTYQLNRGPAPWDVSIYKELIAKALAADPTLAEAHARMAQLKESNDLDFAAAEQEFRRAIALDANNAYAHDVYGDHLNTMGRWPEAEREEQMAQVTDPEDDWLSDGLYRRGEYGRALERERSRVKLHPEDGVLHWSLSRAYFALGRYQEGVAELPPTFKAFGYLEMADALAKTSAANGYKAALRLYAKDLAAVQWNPASPAMVASVYHILGDKDETFRWLEKAFLERDGFVLEIKDPEWQSLRGDPRFESLVRRIGLPH